MSHYYETNGTRYFVSDSPVASREHHACYRGKQYLEMVVYVQWRIYRHCATGKTIILRAECSKHFNNNGGCYQADLTCIIDDNAPVSVSLHYGRIPPSVWTIGDAMEIGQLRIGASE